jgi:hypothetical protein
MAEKKDKTLGDLKEFVDSVNKKVETRNGKRVRFDFVKKKRKP